MDVKAFLEKDLFVVKGIHVTVGIGIVVVVVAWFLLERK